MTDTPHGLAGRAGLDEALLGDPVPLRTPANAAIETVRLDYTHFTVLLRPDRRLAAVAGLGIDGARLFDLERSGLDWRLDPRLPAGAQTGEEVYADNDLDRGHLVRRAAACWGATREEAQQANADTFYYTNAAPQAAAFNQGEQLWLGLENYLLDNAATYDRRLVVFTGPVLDPADPAYRGIQIPRRFFKVAAFRDGSQTAGPLAATGYLLDQTPLLDDLDGVPTRAIATQTPPPPGAFGTYQVPIADLADLTGLELAQLISVDRYTAPDAGAGPQSASPWRRLTTHTDIQL
jgi:endonuclease G